MPHIPLHASEKFVGSSKRGIYGDTIQELDWSTGEILRSLKALGLDENTLVIFTSDNGPHNEGGHNHEFFDSNGPLRGQKRDLYEGGIREPFLIRAPGTTTAGSTSDTPVMSIDFYPTILELAGLPVLALRMNVSFV